MNQRHNLTPEDQRIREWVLSDRGVLRRVADSLDKSPQFVRMVCYGTHKSREVERELRAAGWPGRPE